MVDWDDKERGGPIGMKWPGYGFWLGCTACKHHVCIRYQDAIDAFGADTNARDLVRRLRCTQCGKREGYLLVRAETANPPSDDTKMFKPKRDFLARPGGSRRSEPKFK